MEAASWLISTRRPLPPRGRALIASAAILVAIGIATLYSASFYRSLAQTEGLTDTWFLARQLVGLALGVTALVVCSRIDPRRIPTW